MAKEKGPLVPIVPLPVVISLGPVKTNNGKPLVHMRASTPLGTQHYFLEPDSAVTIAETIYQVAKELQEPTLVVPGTADVIDINKNGSKDG